MKLLSRQLVNVLLSVGCFATAPFACAYEASSQTAKAIKVVVAAPPGGASDILARLVTEQIGRANNLTMIVENRPGASTAIGTEAVARAAPDGNTLLIVTPSFVINSQLRKLTYSPLTSFEPICNLVQSPQLIAVNSASHYRTLGELLRGAQTKPGEVTMAGAGPATGLHIAFEMLKRAAKVDMTFVPYPGDAAAVNALLGEHVTSVFAPYPGIKEQLRAGNLRALATASRERAKALPDVPTFAEAGYDEVEFGHLARDRCAGEHTEGDNCATRGLVHRGLAGAGGHTEARHPGALSGRDLRRGLRGASSQTILRLRPRHSRSEYQAPTDRSMTASASSRAVPSALITRRRSKHRALVSDHPSS